MIDPHDVDLEAHDEPEPDAGAATAEWARGLSDADLEHFEQHGAFPADEDGEDRG